MCTYHSMLLQLQVTAQVALKAKAWIEPHWKRLKLKKSQRKQVLPRNHKNGFELWTFWIVPVSNSRPGRKSPDSLQDGKRPRENRLTQRHENKKIRIRKCKDVKYTNNDKQWQTGMLHECSAKSPQAWAGIHYSCGLQHDLHISTRQSSYQSCHKHNVAQRPIDRTKGYKMAAETRAASASSFPSPSSPWNG